MGYLSTDHELGNVVFVYHAATDSAQRMKVVGITADMQGNSHEWKVLYRVRPAALSGDDVLPVAMEGDQLHRSARDAFPAMDRPAEPA